MRSEQSRLCRDHGGMRVVIRADLVIEGLAGLRVSGFPDAQFAGGLRVGLAVARCLPQGKSLRRPGDQGSLGQGGGQPLLSLPGIP